MRFWTKEDTLFNALPKRELSVPQSKLFKMSHDELDLFVMGQIVAHWYQSSTLHGHQSSTPEERKIMYGQFYHHGQRVCQRTFLFLHNIGIKIFKLIKKSYLTDGPAVSTREHRQEAKAPSDPFPDQGRCSVHFEVHGYENSTYTTLELS